MKNIILLLFLIQSLLCSCISFDDEPKKRIGGSSPTQNPFNETANEKKANSSDPFTETSSEPQISEDNPFDTNTADDSIHEFSEEQSKIVKKSKDDGIFKDSKDIDALFGEAALENPVNPSITIEKKEEENEEKVVSLEEKNQEINNEKESPSKKEASLNTLWWVGFNLQKEKALARVEIITKNDMTFDFIKVNQLTLIVRLYNTNIRKKLLRPLLAAQFSSPIEKIESKENTLDLTTDITITLKEPVQPKYFSKDKRMLLSFPVPEKYLDKYLSFEVPVEKAKVNEKETEINPIMFAGSKLSKKEMSQKNEEKFEDAPEDGGKDITLDTKDEDENKNNLPEEFLEENIQKDDDFIQIDESEDEKIDDQTKDDPIEIESEQSSFLNNSLDETSKYQIINDFYYHAVAADDLSIDAPEENPFQDEKSNKNNEDTSSLDQMFMEEEIKEVSDDKKIKETPAEESTFSLDGSIKEVEAVDNINTQSINTQNNFPPVNLEFKGAKLKDVIRALSSENGVNFIFPDAVGNKDISMNLKNVPWDQALEAILETYSLGLTRGKNNIIRIDTLDMLEQEKKNLENVRKSASLLLPTKVLVVRLSYAKAVDVQKVIEDLLPSKDYDPRVRVRSDARTNSIIVEALPEDLQKIKALVQRIDLQTPQVKISTRVIEVLKDVKKFFGINWGGAQQFNQGRGLGFGNLAFPNNMQSIYSVDTGAQTSGVQSGQWDISFGSINNAIELDLRLRMAELSNYTRGLQNSSVIVLDNEQAMIQAGQIEYFQVPVGDGQTQMSQVDYTLLLEVTPQVTADGAIQMKIKVENGSPTEVTKGSATAKNIRSINTNMLRQNGETAVIGGLYTTLIIKTEQGIPVLSSIPIIGAIFKSYAHVEQKRELMIMVTPTVLNSEKALSGEAYYGEKDQLVKEAESLNSNKIESSALSSNVLTITNDEEENSENPNPDENPEKEEEEKEEEGEKSE